MTNFIRTFVILTLLLGDGERSSGQLPAAADSTGSGHPLDARR